jgi:hypothetical protein
MVKSRTNTFGFWMCLGIVLIGIGMIVSPFLQESTDSKKIVSIIFGLFFTLFIGSQLWREAKIIYVNSFDKTITFVNFFTRQTTIYDFENIEGYVDLFEPARGGSNRVLYIVKDKKFVEKISTRIYSNVKEIQQELKTLKYLGHKRFSYIKSLKILFGQEVFDDK